MSDSFVHLHGHSHYSLLDGGATVKNLINAAKAFNMPALGLTDHGNMFGAIEFYSTCKEVGIKPLVGCEFYVAPGSRFEKDGHGISEAAYHLVVLCQNLKGWQNMLKLASAAFTEGFYYRPRVDKELLAQYSEGLIVINGHFGTELSACLERNDMQAALACAGQYKDIFGDNFYVELQNHLNAEQLAMIPKLMEVSRKVGSPVVATNDHHFLTRDDWESHDALCCISMGRTLSDETRLKYSPELYLKSAAEMRRIFHEIPEACDATLAIAEKCDLKLDFSQRHSPVYTPPAEPGCTPQSPDEYMRDLCLKGVDEKYGTELSTEQRKTIMDRLDYELQVICSKGFASYFLIVWDFCNFARQNGIPVGARGSGVGTVVGYVLGLCNVDPIKYDLLFERFMDPNRSAMPDIDIDICQEGRGKVIDYVRKKYGNVCQIITFNTLGAKAAIKDVGRVMGMMPAETDRITKLIPNALGIELADALKVPDIQKLMGESPQIQRLFATAQRLEGLCRNAGMHAAGVIVCDKPLDTIVPLYKNGEDIMTQWDGPTCEKMGLLKMDFLGLRTLTIVERALDLIEKDLAAKKVKIPGGCNPVFISGRATRIDIERINIADPYVYQNVFQKGNTKGVFQFESGGMKDLLMKMKPDRLEDLIAANALYRPGPMDLIPNYCARKHGKEKIPAIHPMVDEVLAETYGVMVYQEQVMRIFNRAGNIPLRRAYDIIKAISKKKADTIAKERLAFIDGAKANGISKETADELFGFIEKFAGYGFNKSHSTRYAIVAYQTAWLKTYFPAQYMAALLTFEMIDQAKTVEYIDECRHLTLPISGKVGIEILPPDINESDADFTVVEENIRFGMAAVKGVGEKAVQSIIAARLPQPSHPSSPRPFKSLYDFCERVDLRVVNKSVIESLIKCGAFDGLHPVRAASMSAVENAVRMAQAAQEAKRDGQESLFGAPAAGGAGAVPQGEMKLPLMPEWPKAERMALEKSVLGFYVTNHPLRDIEHVFQSYITLDTQSIKGVADKQSGLMGGLISKIRPMMTKSGPNAGKKWAILLIEDLVGTIEVVLYSAELEKFGPLIKPDSVLIFEGYVDKTREDPSFKVKDVMTLEQAQQKKTREILVQTNSVQLDDAALTKLGEIVKQHKGNTHVKLELTDILATPAVRVVYQIGGGVTMHNGALAALKQLFGEEHVTPMGPNRKALVRRREMVEVPQEMPMESEEFAGT